MASNSSGKKLEGFFTGKGFYIVLFLCAAVIGVSAWMMAAGDVAMKNEVPVRSNVNMENKRVETVIIPAETAAPATEAPVFGEAEPSPAAMKRSPRSSGDQRRGHQRARQRAGGYRSRRCLERGRRHGGRGSHVCLAAERRAGAALQRRYAQLRRHHARLAHPRRA